MSGAVQSIAAISEENSAAAEEVSAATEEMSAQAEEVVASAGSLAQMADELDEVVARFVLEGSAAGAAPTSIASRQRPSTRMLRRRAGAPRPHSSQNFRDGDPAQIDRRPPTPQGGPGHHSSGPPAEASSHRRAGANPMSEFQVVVCQLGQESYGLDISSVYEIIRFQECTAVPASPPFVDGVINLRGRIIPVMDMASRFGQAGPRPPSRPGSSSPEPTACASAWSSTR